MNKGENSKKVFDTEKGKNLFLFILFVAISFVFWLLLTLNNQVQKDYVIPLHIKSIPDSTTLISEIPEDIHITVKDKGSALVKYSWGNTPTLEIDFKEFSNNGILRIGQMELKSLVRDVMGNSISLLSVDPDSIHIKYTNLPPKEVPIVLDIDVTPNAQHILSGEVHTNISNVKIYSEKDILSRINEVITYKLYEHEAKDTIRKIVKLIPIAGVKMRPNQIEVMVPIEPLITKTQEVYIDTHLKRKGISIKTFPSRVNATYLVPLSKYKQPQSIVVSIDEADVNKLSKRLAIHAIDLPIECNNLILSQDSVDYIIEKNLDTNE